MFVRRKNPLWRGSDRLETVMLVSLFSIFLLGAPVLAWWAAGASHDADQRAISWERHNLHEVTARLEGTAAQLRASPYAAHATWTAPNGVRRTGQITVAPVRQPGDEVRIWVNRAGDLRSEPGDRNPVGKATLVAIVVVGTVAAAANGLRRIGTALLDRYRARAWQRAWSEIGPRWSRDHRPFS
ncbi:Rv1733c family protein [Actinoplanes sp. CA-252034]|uniref:Rv1733c family protein n=1 Tax=Actinoplanes sp. CA-252034 TaxID=3239906 RepID=UPI003D992DA1